jgi:hypothetical protein
MELVTEFNRLVWEKEVKSHTCRDTSTGAYNKDGHQYPCGSMQWSLGRKKEGREI